MSEPWVEKYRPSKMENIILSDQNRDLFRNIIDKDIYPNMIFYGSPGTGKTTTILCLISAYQQKHQCDNNYIHLNASHQRGIDVIRNQIYSFTKSKNFFNDSKKFVLLDEMDSMTKQAQNQLFHIINDASNNVCFILICNYLNKVIEPIRNSIMIVTFNNITRKSDQLLNECIQNEKVNITNEQVDNLKQIYAHDLRTIINTLQSFNINKHTFISNVQIQKMCDKKTCKRTLSALMKDFDNKTILFRLFQYILESEEFKCDLKLVKMMKYLVLYNQNMNFLIDDLLNHFHHLNTK